MLKKLKEFFTNRVVLNTIVLFAFTFCTELIVRIHTHAPFQDFGTLRIVISSIIWGIIYNIFGRLVWLREKVKLPLIAKTISPSSEKHSGQGKTLELKECVEKAIKNDAEAQYQLGERYLLGNGVSQDQEIAVKWLTRAAEQKHSNALCRLGLYYHQQTNY